MGDPLAQIVSLLRPDLSFSKYIETAGAWRVRRSEEGRPFFSAVLEGRVQLEVPGHAPLVLEANDFILIPSAHDFVSSSYDLAPDAPVSTAPVEIRPNIFRFGDPDAPVEVRMLVGYCDFGSSDAALLLSLLPTLVHVRGDDRLATVAKLAAQELRSDRPAREAIVARLMEVLFIETLRTAGSKGVSGLLRGLGDERIAQAIRSMHETPHANWTIDTLADQAALSRSAFFDRFRRAVGQSPMDYLLQWRMTLAKDLLHRETGSIAEIARQIGYGSASAFSTAFTRHVGQPPSQYKSSGEA
ncbi:hypothetical protein LTR94_023910 [Friedmanniomyces endolithicus]|nr:hypothetical protein LTR94_023910 [Friedmanniomyces endolithicus]